MKEVNSFFTIFVIFFFICVIFYFFNGRNQPAVVQNSEMRRPLLTEPLVSQETESNEEMNVPMEMQNVVSEESNNLEETEFKDQKQKQISEMNNGMMQLESELPGFSLSNRSSDSYAPVNVNVSYNNNRPMSINDFTDQEYNRSLDNYLFDKGFQS